MVKTNLKNFIIIFCIFLVDRISKIFVVNKVYQLEQNQIFSSRFINIELIWNKGIAFGLLSFSQLSIYHLVTMIIIIVIIFVLIMIIKSQGLEKFSYIFISGGAIGNLFDRIFYKAVPDFIDLHVNDFHWFIFNIADIFITIGVLYLICVEIFIKKIND
jgi:signal peptidase II